MEKQSSFKTRTTEKQPGFRNVTFENQTSFHGQLEKQQSFRGANVERHPSLRGFMEKQKSFRVVMERQLSFIAGGERKKNRDSPGKRGDLLLHLAARAGNLSEVKEILQNCEESESIEQLSKQNQEGETPLYVAAENGHSLVVGEMLKHIDLKTASIAARNGYDALHVAAKQGHLGKLFNFPFVLSRLSCF